MISAPPLAAQASIDAWWLLAGFAAAVPIAGYGQRRLRRRKAEALQRLLDRDPKLQPTLTPCGVGEAELAGTAATPRGDRRHGLRYGVTGPIEVAVDGRDTTLECSAFQWWWEQRRRSNTQHGRGSRYVEETDAVAAIRLPSFVAADLRLTPESLLGRMGMTRGGQQMESSEFNRRFRVDATDRTLAVQFLDARMQRRLLEEFGGRSVHLQGSLLLLGGAPSHRDGSLPGVIGQLPAVRQDARRLIEVVPPQFWRAVAAHNEG